MTRPDRMAVAGLTAFALLMAVLFWVGWFPASAVG